jgi:hypothetical protein
MAELGRQDGDETGFGGERSALTLPYGMHAGTIRVTVERSVHAPREARRFVEAEICREHAGRALNAVRLAASEFATQAALLGDGPLEVGLRCDLTSVTTWVVFPTSVPVFGAPLALDDDVAVRVVEAISRDWGAQSLRDAERLWCTIPTGFLPLQDMADSRS